MAMTGVGFVIEKFAEFDVPPPGAGLKTVTGTVAAPPSDEAGTTALNCELVTNDVCRSLPAKRTTEFVTNPEPLTISVNAELPAAAASGLMLVMRGAGLLIINVAGLDVPPPGDGLKTVIANVPPVAMSDAGICTASDVSETKSVWRS